MFGRMPIAGADEVGREPAAIRQRDRLRPLVAGEYSSARQSVEKDDATGIEIAAQQSPAAT